MTYSPIHRNHPIGRLALILVLGLTLSASAQPVIGSAAPNFTLNLAGGGGSVTLANWIGDVVYINFLGATCPDCIADGFLSEEVYDMFAANENLHVIGIDVWNLPSVFVNTTFRANSGITYPLLITGRATGIAYNMEVEPVPSTQDVEHRGHVIIDQQGVIRYYARYNPFGVEQQQEIIALLNTLLDPCANLPQLDPPREATMRMNDDGSDIKLSWQPVPCATHYLVYRSLTGDWNDAEMLGETCDFAFPVHPTENELAIYRIVAQRQATP